MNPCIVKKCEHVLKDQTLKYKTKYTKCEIRRREYFISEELCKDCWENECEMKKENYRIK